MSAESPRPAESDRAPHDRAPEDPEAPSGPEDFTLRFADEEGLRLNEAHRAFELGDYRRVQELCAELMKSEDAEAARLAGDLRRRTLIDPVQVAVVLACLALLGAITYVYVL